MEEQTRTIASLSAQNASMADKIDELTAQSATTADQMAAMAAQIEELKKIC